VASAVGVQLPPPAPTNFVGWTCIIESAVKALEQTMDRGV